MCPQDPILNRLLPNQRRKANDFIKREPFHPTVFTARARELNANQWSDIVTEAHRNDPRCPTSPVFLQWERNQKMDRGEPMDGFAVEPVCGCPVSKPEFYYRESEEKAQRNECRWKRKHQKTVRELGLSHHKPLHQKTLEKPATLPKYRPYK